MMVHLAAPNAHLYVIVVEQLEHLKHAVYCSDSVDQGCPSSGLRVAVVTTRCTVGLQYVTLLARRIRRRRLEFWKILHPPAEDIYRCDVKLWTYHE